MPQSLSEVFSTALFMPHGHCYLWNPSLLWLQVLSNGLIGLSYVAISTTLGYVVYRLRDDIPFRVMYLAFGAFIVLCGITHFFDVYVIWKPAYWVDGGVRALTALVSLGTAIWFPPLIPTAIALARGARTARERGMQLETALYELSTTYQRARELEQLKSQFFANVSHELRTPLTLVLGPLERLLSQEGLASAQREELELALRNAQLLRRQVDDLLDAEKLEAGRVEAVYVATDVASLTRSLASHFEGLANERAVEFRVDTPPVLDAEIDPGKLERVLTNLLSNAFKFTPRGGRIVCTLESIHDGKLAEARSGALRLSVADSGAGIPEHNREAVFERFRQLDGGPTRMQSGTGLGLAIAKELVELQSGTIAVDRAELGGALFRVELPLHAPEGARIQPRSQRLDGIGSAARDASAALRERASAPPMPKASGRPLVLVVEDNPDMNAFVCRLLAEDCNVESARNGREGLEKARAQKPDLIVTDVMMPEVGGEELVRELRARAEFAQVPIMLLTAKADVRLKSELLRAGAQDYLEKPFSTEELNARVANLLGMKRAQEVLRVEKSRVEAANRELDAFSYSVSHDLRAPLRRIDGFGQALIEEARQRMGPEALDLVQRIREETRLMSQLIEDLLQLAKVARSDFVGERVDLAALARQIVARLQAGEPTRVIHFSARGDLEVRGDARLLQIALENLLGNAVKFTRGRAEARIELACEERDGGRVFSLRDNGAGFDPAYTHKLFRPFVRLHSAREFEGTGIGLATVQRIVQRHGGRIWAEGASNGGAVFHFSLAPLSAEQAA